MELTTPATSASLMSVMTLLPSTPAPSVVGAVEGTEPRSESEAVTWRVATFTSFCDRAQPPE